MDRITPYYGQIPLETDLLNAQRYGMTALGMLAQAAFGTNVVVDGLAVTPTGPATLNILVNPGSILQVENLEATTWSSLSADTTHNIVKQGILLDAATFGITPPGTVGYSQVFLVEVQYADQDTGSTVLPYYNASNPALPFSGPANTGTAQNTIRKGIVAIQVKAGTAATTGTQVAPSADAGWTGIYIVTVAYGAASITSGNITKLATAPILTTHGKLPSIPIGIQNQDWVYGADTGSANSLVVTLTPAATSYTAGMSIVTKVAANNTGATVVNVNGLGNQSVVHGDGTALIPGDIIAGGLVGLIYDGTNFQMAWHSIGAGVTIINTNVNKTVANTTSGATGRDFANLTLALQWLSTCIITQSGSVTFNVEAALATATGAISYNAPLILDHPNLDRVSIVGGAVTAANLNLVVTAVNNSTDKGNQLTNLRTVYTTELHFTACSGIVTAGGTAIQPNAPGTPLLKNLLLTGDGAGTNSDGFAIRNNGGVLLDAVSVHGFSGYGFQFDFSEVWVKTVCSATANTGTGFVLWSASVSHYCQVYALSNGSAGMSLEKSEISNSPGGSTIGLTCRGNQQQGLFLRGCSYAGEAATVLGTTTLANNGSHGALISSGSCAALDYAKFNSNSSYGLIAQDSHVSAGTADFASNTSGTVSASNMSFVYTTGATNLGTTVPVINTTGNGNSYVQN